MATETAFHSTSYGSETVLHRRDCVPGMQELLEPESVDIVVTSLQIPLSFIRGFRPLDSVGSP